MALTPQLLQAIKLLQMTNVELSSFVEDELERNPLLERAEEGGEAEGADPKEPEAAREEEGEWASPELETNVAALAQNLDADLSNAFESDRIAAPAEPRPASDGLGLQVNQGALGSAHYGEDAPDLEAYVAAPVSLAEHLERQAMIALSEPRERMLASVLIDALDDSGYLAGGLAEIAERIGVAEGEIEALRQRLLCLEPTGVFARDLAECLALQLIERDRFDPAMQTLIANLPLLARRDHAALRVLCGVDDEDLDAMIAEIRRLEPKPGRAFGAAPERTAIPDVFVSAAPDRSWRVELNSEALPRLLVNESYAAQIKRGATRDEDRLFVSANLQTANWLVKSLEQRARTILNVSLEIVRRQDSFFIHGVSGLRPLNLKSVADAIDVHESTVSRATSHKYMQTPRGLFEMKYFFSTSIASVAAGEAHSAEAVRFKIRQMIDAEDPRSALSDDVIVHQLKCADIIVARRTVAKYRESLKIPSSVERRRAKLAPGRAASMLEKSISL